MKVFAMATLAAMAALARAQSVSIGFDRKSSFTVVEYPVWQTTAFHSSDWRLAVQLFAGTRIGGAKGLGSEISLEKRFYTVRVLRVPVLEARWHLGIGEELFAGDRPRSALLLGISGAF